ncbi:hypothetical protein XENTR_v10002975 [Xenopus tropicalis]|nr:hypothetical protein XENTR_v10002975 [Xenopus tropicalis]
MWKGFALALALCLLPWGGAESQGHRKRLEDLRLKLEKEKLVGISYVVVNHQGRQSRAKYDLLKSKVSEHIPVYQQEEYQPDVWSLLKGDKDDFFVYDRCGRLVQHLELPYSLLHFPYVEEAIRIAYCEDKCGECEHKILDADVCKKPEEQQEQDKPVEEKVERPRHHRNHHRHHRPKHSGHRHRHHHSEDGQVAELDVLRSSAQANNRAGSQNGQGQSVVQVVPQSEVLFVPQREADIPVLARQP